jgi:putative oxidoreductase
MFIHGLANAFGMFGGPGVHQFAAEIASYVSMSPELLAQLIAYGQLLTGLMLMLGLWTRFASIAVLTVLVLGILVTGRYQKFWVRLDGCEYLLALSALSLIIAVHGPGAWCVKIKLPRRDKKKE